MTISQKSVCIFSLVFNVGFTVLELTKGQHLLAAAQGFLAAWFIYLLIADEEESQ